MSYNEETRRQLRAYMHRHGIDPLEERPDLPSFSTGGKVVRLKYSEQRHRQAHLKWK